MEISIESRQFMDSRRSLYTCTPTFEGIYNMLFMRRHACVYDIVQYILNIVLRDERRLLFLLLVTPSF